MVLCYAYLFLSMDAFCLIGMELELLHPLILSIHKPYSQVMLQYPSLEQQLLISNLQKIKIVRFLGYGLYNMHM